MSEAEPLAPAADVGGPQQPLLEVRGLSKHFKLGGGLFGGGGMVRAVDDVSFTVDKGEVLGIVGESGCGKSTTARLVIGLIAPDAGEIVLDGELVGGAVSLRELRRRVQVVFQDSYASVNPRLTIEDTIACGPKVHGLAPAEARSRAHDLLRKVGLDPAHFADRYPHELSGGQRQRVNIARALALNPRLVLLDEAVSALDKSVEAQVLNLLLDLKEELGLTYVFISHDLNVVRFISDRVIVMYLGEVVESGPVGAIWSGARHPYTRPPRRQAVARPRPAHQGRANRRRSAESDRSARGLPLSYALCLCGARLRREESKAVRDGQCAAQRGLSHGRSGFGPYPGRPLL